MTKEVIIIMSASRTTTTTTTGRTTAPAGSKAKARQAKADAAITATAEAIVAEGQSEEAIITDAVHAATTRDAALAAGREAVAYVRKSEATAFGRILWGRQVIGEAHYAAYKAARAEADPAAEVKAATALTWTDIARAVYALDKKGYEALSEAKRPFPRSWSALAEDWSAYTLTATGRYAAAYDLHRGERPGSVREYVDFARAARDAEIAAAKERGEDGAALTPQAKGAMTKKAAREEAARQVKAEADRKAAAKKARDDKADKAITRATHYPHSAIVDKFPAMSGRDLTSCYDVDVLTALADAVVAWRDHVKAMTPAARKAAAEAIARPDTMTEEAVADVTKAEEAEAEAVTPAAPAVDIAAIVAEATAAALAAAGVTA